MEGIGAEAAEADGRQGMGAGEVQSRVAQLRREPSTG